MRLSFDAEHVRRLLDLSRGTERREPVLEQLLDPTSWRNDLPKDRLKLLEKEIREHGIAISARSEDVNPDLIGPGLILVGDQGVYLMANVAIETVKAAGVPHVAYAAEADPIALPFEDWWQNKRASFGADDGTVFLPEQKIAPALSGDKLLLEVTPERISVIESKGPEPDM